MVTHKQIKGEPRVLNDPFPHHLEGIKDQKVALCNLWLETDTQASWSKLCDALWQEGKRVLATQLRAKHVTGKTANPGEEGGLSHLESEGQGEEGRGSPSPPKWHA